MNDIVFAGRADKLSLRRGNCITVFAPDGQAGAVVCTAADNQGGNGVLVCIEQPLMPLPEKPIILEGAEDLRNAVIQAVKYFPSGGAVTAALGELIVAFIKSENGVTEQPVVKTLKSEIEKNFTDAGFSVEVAISKLPLNYDYVRKLFKREVGISPHEYLVSLKMKLAKDLILSGMTNRYSEYTVSQIAEACGFAEPLYFSRVFKKYYGVSPSNFITKL